MVGKKSNTGKKRVVIDARMVGPFGHGIALYVLQLAEGLARLELPYEPFYHIAADCPRDSLLRRLPHAESAIPFLSKKELLNLASELSRLSPALYHTPSFSSLLWYPCPYIQTVHDLNHLHFGSHLQKLYYRFVLLRSLSQAEVVFSVSAATALELRGWLVDFGWIRDVPVAANAIVEFPEADDNSVLKRFGLESGNYFFALSNPKPHKNLALLERAYTAALAERALPPLVVSTPGPGPAGVMYTGPLGGAAVGALLRHAKAFYFPSLYEGFGRPPVEAALSGTVPVVSSIAVHREGLAGVSEAIFLDPSAEPLWKDSFLRMANFSGRVSERSKQWIREAWSMERLADVMDKTYRELLK